jgi:hypothetical protein
MMKMLNLVHPSRESLPPSAPTGVGVDLHLVGSLLIARFSVRRSAEVYVNSALPKGESQWGLWDWDVVELFLSCGGQASRLPYYEFQVSPLGQHLELEILEPRKKVNRDFRSGLRCSARVSPGKGWEGELSVSLDRLGWKGDASTLVGNAFAIVGPPTERTYWSLFLGPQQKPDFHLPHEFRPLF